MELRYQFVYGIELQFRTSATNEGQPHGLIVNISIKIKDMHLNATVYAIIQCRAVADTQHPRMLFPRQGKHKRHIPRQPEPVFHNRQCAD